MEHIVVAFRSRAHTVKFSNLLSSIGVANQIINTPKQAGVGCGLSVKIDKSNFFTVKRVALSAKLNSFAGFFLVKTAFNKSVVKSI